METRVRYIIVGAFALICAAVALLFVLWMQNSGSLGARRDVLIRFQGPTPGLQIGSPVDFDGLRVGEVAGLAFNRSDPKEIDAILSVDVRTPLSATTKAALGSEGLMGSVYVALSGGSPAQPLQTAAGARYPELIAPGSQSLTDQASATLSQINGLIGENAKPFHEIITNIQNFSAVLSHNSGRVDAILQGLARLTGAGSSSPPPVKLFDLAAPKSIPGFKPSGRVQLVVGDPTSVIALDTQKFLSQAANGQLVLQTSQWTDSIPKLVQSKVVDAFANAKFNFASPPTDGLNPDYQLLLDVRAFQIEQGPPLQATVRLTARLQGHDGKIISANTVEGVAPATAVDGPAAADAMSQAFAAATEKLLDWCQGAIASQTH
jgi:phospholipid/cholesterol/gamma-HCH transport system substrate-binding protein